MPTAANKSINILCMMGFLILMGLIQSVVWFQIFHPVPQPNLWLPVVVYFSLYRTFNLGITSIYLAALIIATGTSQPLHFILLSLVILYFTIQLFRLKFFWSGAGYFLMVSCFAVIMLHLINFILSLNLETNFLRSPRIAAWISELIMTPLFAPIIFALLRKMDAMTHFQTPNEYGFESL